MEDFLMTMKVLRRFFQTASTRSNNMNNIIVQLYMGSSTSGLSSGKLAFPDRGTLFEFFLLLCFPYTPLEVLGSKEKENNLEWWRARLPKPYLKIVTQQSSNKVLTLWNPRKVSNPAWSITWKWRNQDIIKCKSWIQVYRDHVEFGSVICNDVILAKVNILNNTIN